MARLTTILSCLGTLIGIAAAVGLLPDWVTLPAVLVPTICLLVVLATLREELRTVLTRIRALPDFTEPVPAHPRLLEPLHDALDRLARITAQRTATGQRARQAGSAILDRLPDPLVILDANGGVPRLNQAARLSFGPDLPSVLRHPALRAAMDRALKGERVSAVEVSLSVPVPREVLATLIPLDPGLVEHERVALVLSDRSREKAMERVRADFVANVSHELRTPLTTLVGFTETLLGPAADDPPARARFLGIMADQGRRMSRLIDDLLSLSRVELVEHQPPIEPVALEDLTSRVLTFYAERRARIVTTVEAGLPPVAGDADQLVQVWQNLLDNALKYGRQTGMVRLSIGHAPPGSDWPAGGLVITVADEGAGIPSEHLPRLTERFYRVDKARSRSAGGTGLGLAIVKHIVNRHRGQLRIASILGVGTTVSVWLPLAGTRVAEQAAAMAAEAAPAPR